MKIKTTKREQVLQYLQEHGSITTWIAIQEFGATRLSSIIFDLRKHYDIETEIKVTKDRNGNLCQYAEYKYLGRG